MNPYNFATLLFAFGSFFVGLLVWLKRNDSIGRTYFVFSTLTAIWALGFALMFGEHASYETALWSARVADAAALFIPATWLHLILLISGKVDQYKKLLVSLYVFSVIVFCFAFSPLFVSKVKPIMNFRQWLHPGPVFHLFTILFFTMVPYGFVILYQRIKRSFPHERTQLLGFFWAAAIGFIGGALTFLPNYDIQMPQYGIFLMPIYPFITAYFLIRHHLFDLETVAQLFQREKLATIGLLAASVNHEIRNPLYVAKTTLESYIETQENGGKAKESLDASKKSLSAVNRALDVITKLNRFAKPSEKSATEISMGKQEANIQEAIQNVLDLVSYEFELDKIKINNQIPIDLPPIQADQRQLEEILFNLIVNACHAMEKGGMLVIASESLSFPRKRESMDPRLKHMRLCRSAALLHSGMTGKVQIVIQDSGSGISKEHLAHLFEPFHTTKGEKGTGLGLYITKQLVERNGGKIAVKSQTGKGTSFALEFPIKLVKNENHL